MYYPPPHAAMLPTHDTIALCYFINDTDSAGTTATPLLESCSLLGVTCKLETQLAAVLASAT